MNTTVATRLDVARTHLEELGLETLRLAVDYLDVFDGTEFSVYFEKFQSALDEAKARLASPTLSIATIGTTSSGKSTLINALVGRRIAPMEAGEMSGGILTLRHSVGRRLTVERVGDVPWDTGVWPGISDLDAYNRTRDGIMQRYHETRKSRPCPAPQVCAEGPLLPSVDNSLLGLPPDLGVEFIDLPGLKSVHDRDNLTVIQARVCKAFSLVVLDYLQTDENHRKKLLEELKNVVKYWQGRTDSMIFVLNRVDHHGQDDVPIQTRVDVLRREIKEALGLRGEPDVLPFESRVLYNAQCAWGATDNTRPSTTPEQRQQHLKGLFEDSATTLKKQRTKYPEIRSWLRQIEEQVEEGEVVSDADLRALVERVREWSGGQELWRRLRARVEGSFADLVILPALSEVHDTHRSWPRPRIGHLN